MTRAAKRKVKRIIRELSAYGYKRCYDWKGYEVYEPVYPRPSYVGGPLFILVSGDNARLAPDDEGREYLNYHIQKTKKEKRAAS